jgi:hypothetical protein
MSDGHYCVIRDLGPVRGGKGLKHHEVVFDFTWRALTNFCPSDGAAKPSRHIKRQSNGNLRKVRNSH